MSKRYLLKSTLLTWKENVSKRVYIKYKYQKYIQYYFNIWKNYSRKNWKLSVRAQVYRKLKTLKTTFLKFVDKFNTLQKEKLFYKTLYYKRWKAATLKIKYITEIKKKWILKTYFHFARKVYFNSRNISRAQRNSIFKKWKNIYQSKQYYKQKLSLAQDIYEKDVLCKVLRVWNFRFVVLKQKKMEIQESIKFSRRKSLKRFLRHWKIKRILVEFKRNLRELADWTAERNLVARGFRGWRLRAHTAGKENEILGLITESRLRKVMQEFVKVLKKTILTRRYVQMSRELYILKHAFCKWKQEIYKIEEIRDRDECRPGISHFNFKVLEKSLRKWSRGTVTLIEKRARGIKAVHYSHNSCLQKSFTSWYQEWKTRKLEARKVLMAERYSRKRILRTFMEFWDASLSEKQDFAKKMNKAKDHHEIKLKKRVFCGFQEHLLKIVEDYYFMESAVVHYNRRVAINVLKAFEKNVIIRERSRDMDILAKSQNFKIRMKRCLSIWFNKTKTKKRENIIKTCLKFNYDFTQKRICFQAWKEYVFAKNNFMIAMKDFEERVARRKISVYLINWADRASKNRFLGKQLAKVQVLRKAIALASSFAKYMAAFRRRRLENIEKEKRIRLFRSELNMKLKKKIIKAWIEYYTIKIIKTGRTREAKGFYSKNVFRNCLNTWTRNCRHKRWVNKVNGKADLLIYTKYVKNAFRIWFEKKTDWKEIYFNQKVKPKVFYEMQLKRKTVSAWNEFIRISNAHKERLVDARATRAKLILSDALRAWIQYADSLNYFELRRSEYLQKKYATIWKDITLKHGRGRIQAHGQKYSSRDIIPLTSGKRSTRPAPRMPQFLMESFERDGNQSSNVAIPNPKHRDMYVEPNFRDFSIQTELFKNQETLNRIDSGIDVNLQNCHESTHCKDDSKNGTRSILESIFTGLFDRPLKEHQLDSQKTEYFHQNNAARFNEVDKNVLMDPKTLFVMERKLSEFQDSKTRYKNNLERLRLAQKDVDSILIDPQCPSSKLKEKIQEIELLGKEIAQYKRSVESRKKEMDGISQKLLVLIQKARYQIA